MKFITLLLFVIPLKSVCQTDTTIYYQGVAELSSMKHDQIYSGALAWCADAYKNYSNAINFADKDAGVIKGAFIIYNRINDSAFKKPEYAIYKGDLRIDVKDEKIRFTLENVTVFGNKLTSSSKPPFSGKKGVIAWPHIKKNILTEGEALLISLQQYIQKRKDW